MDNKKSEILISAVGDISLGEHPFCVGWGVRSVIHSKGEKFIFSNVKKIFEKSDIVFGNLEGVLFDIPSKSSALKDNIFRGDESFIKVLKSANFNVLVIANNHILQYGEEGFKRTVGLLNSGNIAPLGIRAHDGCFHCKPVIIKRKNLSVAMLAYSLIKDSLSMKDVYYAYGEREKIINDIKLLKNKVDFIVIALHWGLELIDKPSHDIVTFAHDLIDNGCDVILGAHSHVFQGIERYKNGLICYSLGNFVFDIVWNKDQNRTFIADIRLSREYGVKYKLIPVIINEKTYQPCLVDSSEDCRKAVMCADELSKSIFNEDRLDGENKRFDYYMKVNRLSWRNQLLKLLFLIKNFYRVKWIKYLKYKIKEKSLRK